MTEIVICDGCKKDVHSKAHAQLGLLGYSPYDLCDDCYAILRQAMENIPTTEELAEQRYARMIGLPGYSQ